LKKGIKNPSMATTPHEPNQRLKPAQAATRHRGIAINAQGVRKPIIRPSCLGEFEWPQVGEFEVAIRAQQALGHRQELGLFAGDVPLVQLNEPDHVVLGERRRLACRHLREHRAQRLPARFEFTVLGGQRRSELAQADRVRTRHGLDQRGEEIALLVIMMVSGRRVEVAHHCRGGFLRRPIRSVCGDM